MNRILIALVPLALAACGDDPFGAFDRYDGDDGWNSSEYGWDDSYENDVSVYQRGEGGSLSGTLPTVGRLENAPADGWVTATESTLDFDLTTHLDDGRWGMIGGWVVLDGPLRPGQVLSIEAEDVVGCSGPEGTFDYDAPPEDAMVIVDETPDGDIELTFDFDFGQDGDIVGVAVLENDG